MTIVRLAVIPVSSTGMTRYKPYRHAATNRHTAIHSRYL
ncbi:hypothetical protein WANA34_0788 [Wolbachia endosymbiont of Drosophila ananassae]|nr:hypothetical protein WANA34_0788 [Wolbachia endosymbiont of Drosophila ananassae]RLT62045.1 hypothetical protein WANA13_1251 [Wolbachia endosymbiont of Drosophila ananassae]